LAKYRPSRGRPYRQGHRTTNGRGIAGLLLRQPADSIEDHWHSLADGWRTHPREYSSRRPQSVAAPNPIEALSPWNAKDRR
jgi:hypothetical protein